MTMHERIQGIFGKIISLILIITTQGMTAHIAYAQAELTNSIIDANEFARKMSSDRRMPVLNNNGDIIVNGEKLTSQKEITGQKDSDFIPAQTDSFGDDGAILNQGSIARDRYEQSTLETAPNSGAKAYHMVKRSFQAQKPDLTNDPMWDNTDNILDNLTDIAKGFANCEIDKELISSGKDYHVPKYETCEKLPALEESFTISHDYQVGVLKLGNGPANLAECGDGCFDMWAGEVRTEYLWWKNNTCTIYEEKSQIEVIQPDAILSAVVDYSKFDDFYQLTINDNLVYEDPVNYFPPEIGECTHDTGDNVRTPNIDVTNEFRSLNPHDKLNLNSRVSIYKGGWGYSRIKIHYDKNRKIYNDVWSTLEQIDKAFQIKKQFDDGFCEGHITCASMPALDAAGCLTENGIKVCESDFQTNPVSSLGISPFCKRVDVVSNCSFNEGEFCSIDMDGVEHCIDNDTATRNTCVEYEDNPECSYVKTECVEGAEGGSGDCYLQEDTYDCGYTVNNGTETEEEVLRCDGVIQCIGESCYSPVRDTANDDFAEVNAYLEMLKYARADMTCQGIPDAPYNEDAPPETYYPVKTCKEGYHYNKDIDKCLRQTMCSYDENNFYAASIRNGVQVVSQNAIVADNDSITNCVPISENGQTFTCGEAMKKLSTDTFYEVCTNDESPVISDGCPNEEHTLNPINGFCQVPPIPTCPDGLPLVEGSDPWSIDDDKCLLEVPATPVCNSSNETYNSITGLCESSNVVYTPPYCRTGVINGNVCESVKEGCYYDIPNIHTRNYGWIVSDFSFGIHVKGAWVYESMYGCLDGSGTCDRWTPAWRVGDVTYRRGAYRERPGGARQYDVCFNETIKEATVCPSGYQKVNNNCQKQTTVTTTPSMTCSVEGSHYDPSTDSCRIEEPATRSCPSFYPIWNEAEGRCTTDKYDVIRASATPFKMNNLDSQPYHHDVLKPLLESVLAPVAALFEVVMPNVVANDNLHESEESQITQESMNAYIAGRFKSVTDRMINDKELYQVGMAQLSTMGVQQSTTATVESYASIKSGTSNVVCELFKSDAMECKKAVGGMQDCCKNPVAISMADYIKMGRTMLTMDGLTGQVFGLENYSGAWNMASEGVGNAANTAWEAVSGLWSSGADAATGAATNAATEQGIGYAFGQALMTYTNNFLTSTFGPQVASMFFTTTGTGAGATIGPSTAMASAGAALMVVYYAYLAYVVFNLLVNIIYECEEEEMDLAMKRDLLSTHYLGSYCKTEVLGACIEKRESYCVFDSPLSRIMMEQVYAQPQMNLEWGSAKNPNCGGLKIDELANVDWDAVNLDEWIGILVKTDNYTDMVDIDIDSLTGNGSNLATDEDRLDVLERNKERMENINAEEVKRDAYEEAWGQSQPTTP